MGNIRPVAAVVLDAPRVCGSIVEDEHHYAYDWRARYDPEDPQSIPWNGDNVEYIAPVQAIGPRALVGWSDMVAGDWTFPLGEWRLARPAITKPRVNFFHLRNSAVGTVGTALSNNDYGVAQYYRFLRFVPPDGETLTPTLGITWFGPAETYNYALTLPWGGMDTADAESAAPRLYRYDSGTLPDLSAPLAEMPDGTSTMTAGSEPMLQDVMMELLDTRYLLIRISNGAQDWLVDCGDYPPLTGGQIQVEFIGHSGMFSVQPVRWASGVTARPATRRGIPGWQEPNIFSAWVGYQPAGTTIALTEDVAGDFTRPVITFTGTETFQRPLVYRVQTWSLPGVMQDASDPATIAPTAITWERNNRWRGASFTAEYADWDYDIELAPNMQATLQVAWDTGGAPPAPVTRIIGYLDGAVGLQDGADTFGQHKPTLRATDHPAARLSNCKWCRDIPELSGWGAAALFEWLLNGAGVHSDYITVDAGVTVPAIGRGEPPWEGWKKFPLDFGLIEAMDEIFVNHWGLQWGWNETGYFLRPRPEYEGTPDWTMDFDTETMAEMATVMTTQVGIADMRNYVACWSAESGGVIAARDADSHFLATAPNYVGDDRWEVLQQTAETDAEALAMVQARLQETSRFALEIEITTEYATIGPDSFILIEEHPNPAIPDNAVFRVVAEQGRGDGNDMRVTYTCVFETIHEEPEEE